MTKWLVKNEADEWSAAKEYETEVSPADGASSLAARDFMASLKRDGLLTFPITLHVAPAGELENVSIYTYYEEVIDTDIGI